MIKINPNSLDERPLQLDANDIIHMYWCGNNLIRIYFTQLKDTKNICDGIRNKDIEVLSYEVSLNNPINKKSLKLCKKLPKKGIFFRMYNFIKLKWKLRNCNLKALSQELCPNMDLDKVSIEKAEHQQTALNLAKNKIKYLQEQSGNKFYSKEWYD